MLMKNLNKILITRTDRIGDVVLSTPVIAQLKAAFPNAKLSFLTTPYTVDLIEGNPDIEEVIVYDKKVKHKNFFKGIVFFALMIARKRFDAVIVLHPTNRMHMIAFLAGIPIRIGWDRKYGNLLTHKLEHSKQLGQKHESEYNLDLLTLLDIKTTNPVLSLPYSFISKTVSWDILESKGIKDKSNYIVFALGSSCPSKQWPVEFFAELANKLQAIKTNCSFAIIGSAAEKDLSDKFLDLFDGECLDLTGKLSLKEVIFFFKHIHGFIGNDSGLSHIAASFEIPLISIFGRSDPGLSPKRWQPLGEKSVFLHKDVGCVKCLAHECQKSFHCIRSILVDEVLNEALELL